MKDVIFVIPDLVGQVLTGESRSSNNLSSAVEQKASSRSILKPKG